jgi:hypothetical protein
MNEEDFDNWIAAYIDIYDSSEDLEENHPSYWAIERFVDLEAEFPETCWVAILTIVAKQPSNRILENLAAGPLEELLELHGVGYIDRIEKEAHVNPEFRNLLNSLWKITDEAIWKRILRARLGN